METGSVWCVSSFNGVGGDDADSGRGWKFQFDRRPRGSPDRDAGRARSLFAGLAIVGRFSTDGNRSRAQCALRHQAARFAARPVAIGEDGDFFVLVAAADDLLFHRLRRDGGVSGAGRVFALLPVIYRSGGSGMDIVYPHREFLRRVECASASACWANTWSGFTTRFAPGHFI